MGAANSKSAETSNTSDAQCSSCGSMLPKESAYKCKLSNDAIEIVCEFCVVLHTRKDHLVLDFAGRPVTLCKKHKTLASKYCNGCEVAFCLHCLEAHIQHDYTSLIEKANKAKRILFNLFENLGDIYEQTSLKRENLAELLAEKVCSKDLYEIMFGGLEKYVIGKIESLRHEHEKSEMNSKQDFDEAISKADDLHYQLRSALQLSDGDLIKCCSQLSHPVKQSVAEQKLLVSKASCVPCLPKFDESVALKEAVDSFMDSLSLSSAQKEENRVAQNQLRVSGQQMSTEKYFVNI